MELSYRTRAESSAQGKPKVYFTCHEADFERYFKSVSDEVLEDHNCAVFYRKPGQEIDDREDYEEQLEQMQMLVIPVTTNFLLKPSQAMEDFQLAMKRHKPVLPLMQEPYLEELFNRTCCNLQFLDRNQKDDTAISYEKKRKKFIKSILVGDQLAERVRKSFDAYIFLSYRKKDRKEANRLMRMIHENKRCRNFAIWYDEYLIPGENFNQTIREALDQSHLFVLAVTPNLVNEDNYIRHYEYPAAVNSQKPILPVMMQETDVKALREQYSGIPDSVDGTGKPDLVSNAVLQRIQSQVQVERNDPIKEFLMGIAYLSGIDVEVNTVRGVTLIRSAAEAGCMEAMEKLAYMYFSGDAVKRNYEKTHQWLLRRCDRARELYEQNQNTETRQNYLDALWDLSAFLMNQDKTEDTERVFLLIQALERDQAKAGSDAEKSRGLGRSYQQLGVAAHKRGKDLAAEAYFQKAIEIHRAMMEETDLDESRMDLAKALNEMGLFFQDCGKYKCAIEYFEQSIQINKVLAEKTGTTEAYDGLCANYNNMANVLGAEGKTDQAEYDYEQAIRISETLEKETGAKCFRSNTAFICQNYGTLLYKEEKYKQAKEKYSRALEIFKELAEELQSIYSRTHLAQIYHDFGVLYYVEGNSKQAEKSYLQAIRIQRALVNETGSRHSRNCLAITYHNLSVVYEEKRWSTYYLHLAIQGYQAALECHRALAEDTESLYFQRDLACDYLNLAKLEFSYRWYYWCSEYLEHATEIFKAIAEETGTIESRSDLADSYQLMGTLARSQGKYSEAEFCYRKAIEIQTALTEETDLVKYRRSLAFCNLELCMLFYTQKEFSRSAQYDVEAISILESIFSSKQSKKDQKLLYNAYGNMRQICLCQGDRIEAKQWSQKQKKIRHCRPR